MKDCVSDECKPKRGGEGGLSDRGNSTCRTAHNTCLPTCTDVEGIVDRECVRDCLPEDCQRGPSVECVDEISTCKASCDVDGIVDRECMKDCVSDECKPKRGRGGGRGGRGGRGLSDRGNSTCRTAHNTCLPTCTDGEGIVDRECVRECLPEDCQRGPSVECADEITTCKASCDVDGIVDRECMKDCVSDECKPKRGRGGGRGK